MVADHVPLEREVIFHSENGVLGMGPAPPKDKIDPWLVNAGKQHVTLRTGGSFCHHADSFAMIRGGHLDLCVLGALEVADNGDLANWSKSANDPAPAVGGAMDLAVGSKRVWVLMEHTTKEGEPKILKSCSLPLTGLGVVDLIVTDLGVIEVTPDGLVLREVALGVTPEEVEKATGAALRRAPKIETMKV